MSVRTARVLHVCFVLGCIHFFELVLVDPFLNQTILAGNCKGWVYPQVIRPSNFGNRPRLD
jgi:hypothetical protein